MISSGISVREATINDIEAIMKIENDSFVVGIRESTETFLERLSVFEEGFLVLADEDNCPVGYITSELWKYRAAIDEEAFELGHSIKDIHDPKGEEMYISSMGVLKGNRGEGLGGMLFQTLLGKVQKSYPGTISASVLVSETWTVAYNIYKKNGFNEVHIVKDFLTPRYEKWSNGIVMRRKFSRT